MSVTHTHGRSFDPGTGQISNTKAVTCDGDLRLPTLTIADGVSNQLLSGYTIDFSQLSSLYIVATKAMTIETNDSGTPDDSITLVANVPYQWFTGDYSSCLITQDATTIYATNASGSSGDLTLYIGHGDVTP